MATTRFADHLLTGTHASRPAANAVPVGTLYSCTTHGLIYQSDGSTWSTYATLGSTETLPATIIDAKGDLIGGTAADTAARLAVGSDGQVLTAASGQTTGLQWASVGATGAVTLLSTTTLGSAGTFDVSSISGSYNDLICVLIGRGAVSGTTDTLKWNLNNDTGTNYHFQYRRDNATTDSISGTISAASFSSGGRIPGSTALANTFGIVEFTIHGYASTTWSKPCLWRAFSHPNTTLSNSSMNLEEAGGFWNSTSAVTRIQVAATTTANLLTGSQLRIYGRL